MVSCQKVTEFIYGSGSSPKHPKPLQNNVLYFICQKNQATAVSIETCQHENGSLNA